MPFCDTVSLIENVPRYQPFFITETAFGIQFDVARPRQIQVELHSRLRAILGIAVAATLEVELKNTSAPIHIRKISMNNDLTNDAFLVATKQQVSCELGEEAAILNMKNSVYYGLDPVGARIWQLLQQPTSMSAIRDVIVEEYDVSLQQAESDIRDLLEKLLAEGLVELATGAR